MIAAVAVAATAVAGYVVAGPDALTVIFIATAVAALVVVRWLLPPAPEPEILDAGTDSVKTGWASYRYWHSLADLRDGIAARAAYEARLRPSLEHLLAARLAERHGVNLYSDPEQARRLLCPGQRDHDLWAWIDPARALRPDELTSLRSSDSERPGIPRRTLERLMNRLEQL
jgi:hypothetical protein